MSGQLQSSAAINELATLLIPVCGRQLILPNVSVAEVIPFVAPVAEADMPNWYLGKFRWRNTNVPLVSFEAINDEPFSGSAADRRIAVLNGLEGDDRLPFCGLLVDGMPRLMRVAADEIAVDTENEAGPAELSRVVVSGERAVIPHVDFIQSEVLKLI